MSVSPSMLRFPCISPTIPPVSVTTFANALFRTYALGTSTETSGSLKESLSPPARILEESPLGALLMTSKDFIYLNMIDDGQLGGMVVDQEDIVLVGYDAIALFFSIGGMDNAEEGYYLRENFADI